MKFAVLDLPAEFGGALTVLRDFYNFAEGCGEHKWVFFLSTSEFRETENIKIVRLPEIKKSWAHRIFFELFKLKSLVRPEKPDVVFSLQNTSIYRYREPQVLYVHQPVPFQKAKKFSFFKRGEFALAVYQKIIGRFIKNSIRSVDSVIVQTKWMRDAIVSDPRVPPEKLHIVRNGATLPPGIHFGAEAEGRVISRKFIYPAFYGMYKNQSCIFEAVRMLVSRGVRDFEVVLTVDEALRPPSASFPQITFAGAFEYGELLKKYTDHILLFPSYIESLGLPLIESRMAGTPIFASDTEFSRELLDGYVNARFFDPFRPDVLCALMEGALQGDLPYESVTSESSPGGGWDTALRVIESAGKDAKHK